MQSNGHNLPEATENWDLPVEAIEEIVRYCEGHRRLIEMEAEEERHWLELEGAFPMPRDGPQRA